MDSSVISLRSAIQKIEASGNVDFSLGGHVCARPADVQQGRADDHFEISPDSSTMLLWRPNNVPAKNIKNTNLASQFAFPALMSSPLALAPDMHSLELKVYFSGTCIG